MTARKGHPNSRPLPGPDPEPAFISAAQGLVGAALLDQVMQGATPQRALLAAARELIRQAQELERIMPVECGGCAPPVITGGPRFTETK